MKAPGRDRILLVVTIAGGLLGVLVLVWNAMPLRSGGPVVDVGGFPLMLLPMTLVLGVVLGRLQILAAQGRESRFPFLAILTGLIGGLVVHHGVTLTVQFGRAMPVVGGGPSLDPTAGELLGGVLYWAVFVAGACVGVVLRAPRPVADSSGPAT